jgi:hypothetical protein
VSPPARSNSGHRERAGVGLDGAGRPLDVGAAVGVLGAVVALAVGVANCGTATSGGLCRRTVGG